MQRKGFGEDFRGTRDAKWTKQPSTGRGRDAIGRLFDLYSVDLDEGMHQGAGAVVRLIVVKQVVE